jgi:hypothetical protein
MGLTVKEQKMNNINKVSHRSRPSTFWNQDELDLLRKKYLNEVKSIEQWYNFLQTNSYQMVIHASSSYPLNYENLNYPINIKEFTFKKIAEVKSFNICKTLEKLYHDNQNINANNSKVCTTREQHFKDEIKFLKSNGFDKPPHVFNPPKHNYEEIHNLINKLNLDHCVFQFRIQAPGSTQQTHVDALDCLWGDVLNNLNEKIKDINNNTFDPVTKCPEGYYAIRLLIPFTKYEPGHVFGFEDQYWTGWEQGDIITFDWANIFHYTANTSFTNRIVLKITGVTSDPNHWVFDAINNDKIITL